MPVRSNLPSRWLSLVIARSPLGAGGMPVRSNLPSRWLSLVRGRSPSYTLMVTTSWLSAAVEKVWDFLVGMGLFLGMTLDMTPPTVSMPRLRGTVSMTTMSLTPQSSPDRMQAWTAAPSATASSGLTPLLGSLPLKKSFTSCLIFGILVDPPTRIMSVIVIKIYNIHTSLERKKNIHFVYLLLFNLNLSCFGEFL